MRALLIAALCALSAPSSATAWPRHSSGGSYSHSYATSASSSHRYRGGSSSRTHAAHVSASPGTVQRDANGKIHRSREAKASFRKDHPCPSTGSTRGACPGYEVDHVRPLACGGPDNPGNMQWLTKAENRAKGSEGCRR